MKHKPVVEIPVTPPVSEIPVTPVEQAMDPIAALDAILAQFNELLPQAPQTRANIVRGMRISVEHLVSVLMHHGYKPKA